MELNDFRYMCDDLKHVQDTEIVFAIQQILERCTQEEIETKQKYNFAQIAVDHLCKRGKIGINPNCTFTNIIEDEADHGASFQKLSALMSCKTLPKPREVTGTTDKPIA